MTDLLAPGRNEKVLEVGTGLGYQTAILAELAGEVCSVEIVEEFTEGAQLFLGQLGYTNVRIRTGDGSRGWLEHAPFDKIMVTAAAASIAGFAKRSLDPDCAVVSDGLQCFTSVTDAGCTHQVVTTGSGPKAARTPAFKWVNTALGNIKAAITGTYRAINSKHVPRYLAEFEYRFNRRYDLAAMIPRLTWAAVRTAPMPYRLLKLAEVYA